MRTLVRFFFARGTSALAITAFAGALFAGPTNFSSVQAFVFSPFDTTIYSNTVAFGLTNTTVSGSWTCDTCTGFSASGAGQAGMGVLGAMVDLNVPGLPSAGFGALAETESHFNDDLTITGGTGPGVLELRFTVTGSTNSFLASGGLALCDNVGCSDPNVYFTLNSGALTGENTSQPGFNSNATVTFYIPFTYGTQFEIEPFMNTQAQFDSSRGTPNDIAASFNNTAVITSALILNGTSSAPGSVVGGSITDDDGFTYGPNGLSSGVPEPGSWLLAASALAALALVRARNRKRV